MRFRPPAAARAALVLALLPLLGPALRAEEPGALAAGPTLGVPEVRAVQLDGVVREAEWEGAARIALDEGGTELRLGQRSGTLLLALTSPLAWPPRGHLLAFFAPPGAPDGLLAAGAVRVDYEPFEHDRPHVIAHRVGPRGEERIEPRIVVRTYRTSTRTEVEAAVQLADLPVADGALRMCLRWSRPGAPRDPVWPAGLDLGASPGGVPAGLRTGGAWARLADLVPGPPPGAFPASRWAAWAAEDLEIARRGAAAHAVARELREEWRKMEKRDRELVPEVLGNLDWIAEREPLSPSDLLERAHALRFLNRRGEAAALLEVLAHAEARGLAYRALKELAALRAAAQDFEAAARALERAGALAHPDQHAALAADAARLRERGAAWAAEAEARAGDAADPRLPRVALHTPHGSLRVVLHAPDVPQAVAHFLALAREGLYDGTLFHSVKGEGRVLGGDPLSREAGCEAAGTGRGPRQIPLETNARHGAWRGALVFARRQKEENGCQFFLLVAPPDPPLDRPHTVFGHVEAGYGVLDRLEQCDPLERVEILPPRATAGDPGAGAAR